MDFSEVDDLPSDIASGPSRPPTASNLQDNFSTLSGRNIDSERSYRINTSAGASSTRSFSISQRRHLSRPTTGLSFLTSRSSFTTSASSHSRAGTARPRTAQSTRPQTAASNVLGNEPTHVCAVLEGRGVGREVGIAVLDKETGNCMVTQFADTQTYVKTIHQLSLHPPMTILVPAGSLASGLHSAHLNEESADARGFGGTSSVLVLCLEDSFECGLTPLKRIYWNHEEGAQYIDKLLVEDADPSKKSSHMNEGEKESNARLQKVSELTTETTSRAAILVALSNKYYALSACSALFKYTEAHNNRLFSPRSLKIRFVAPDGTMMIDNETARNLELVDNALNRRSRLSLYGLLDKCRTPMAQRLLRMSLLQPLTDQNTIDSRLDVVEEFTQAEEQFYAVQESLKPLDKLDLDKLIGSIVAYEDRPADPRRTETKISQMLSLRTLLQSLGLVRRALQGSQSGLLQAIKMFLDSNELDEMLEKIQETLNDDLTNTQNALSKKTAKIYAVKANHSPLLDVARETYKENVTDMFDLGKHYADTYKLPTILKLVGNSFLLELKGSEYTRNDIPAEFTNVNHKGGRWTMTTLEIKKRNQRVQDSLTEVFMLSEEIIEGLRQEVVARIAALYKVSEALALLDMLASFAYMATTRNYVRPEFTGTLAIKAGRHPILDRVAGDEVVPNDAYATDGASFFVITGPNMSGKTTYLRQLALLTVMALVGSFVPAEYASFRIHDAILTRLSNDDNLEQNLSTFSSEMRTTAFILSLVGPRSLVLCDELGRGTVPHEGFGISHAIAEALIDSKAFVYFATHFRELTDSLSVYPSVVPMHFEVGMDPRSDQFGMTFHHRLVEGRSAETHYGLELAKLAGLPADLHERARQIATQLADIKERANAASEGNKIAGRRKLILRLHAQLKQTLENSQLTDADLREFLRDLQREFVEDMRAAYDVADTSAPTTRQGTP